MIQFESGKSMDENSFRKSIAYYEIIHFVTTINRSVKGKKLRTKLKPSKMAANLVQIIGHLNEMIDQTPTVGNWFEKMRIYSTDSLQKTLKKRFHRALTEISTYFIESFGNVTQHGIHYGVEHELAFVMFLSALFQIVALNEKDKTYVGLKLFDEYLQCIRRLRSTYRVESAGNHSVSTMDDHHRVSFIWGSAQLMSQEPFEPKRSCEKQIIDRYKKDYIFIKCVEQLGQEKPHSFVDELLDFDSWADMNSFLIYNFRTEVNDGLLHSFSA